MGEVFRAHDARLNRDVAIKVVPPSVANDPDALVRFERESHAIAALSHPNILAIFDVGHSEGRPFAVMELLEGETLRARLGRGPLPVRKAVEIAGQIARGLAAAHDKQIAHRDLKPDNVFLTPTGGVKILDFGLARSTSANSELTRAESPTMAPATTPGTVLGTVGYMAPEQVRGEPADHRSDLFALGCVLYEMLTGERAYKRETAAETMSAILREDPPDPSTLNVAVPPGVLRALRRCLEKRPQERFESARDLAFALESAIDSSSTSASSAFVPVRDRRWLAGGVALVAVGAVVGFAGARLVNRPSAAAGPPLEAQFHQLTFDKGTIRDGRFTPDGQSIVYGAAWNGQPLKLFMVRTDSPESAPLSLPSARLLAVSKSGELALSIGHTFDGWMGEGTLARSSLLGSAPRVVAEHVREADWTPDGSDLALVRRGDGFERLEFPLGKVLYQTSGYISDVRFSPSGDRIAFADHPVYSDDAGAVAVVDKEGHRTTLSDGWTSVHGIAWNKDGSEIWFGATKGTTVNSEGVFAVTSEGRVRTVAAGPTRYKVLDIAADGRVLVGRDRDDRVVEGLLAGSETTVDLSVRSTSLATWVADDGRRALVGDLSTAPYQTYLFKLGDAPVRLGAGQPMSLSPDGRWALAAPVDGRSLLLHPTGPGASRTLPNPENIVFNKGGWLDANRIIAFGQKAGERSQGYIQDINSGPPRRFTPEGAELSVATWWTLPISPDGTRVIVTDDQGSAVIYPIAGGPPTPVQHLKSGDVVVQWSADGRGLLVAHREGLPWLVERMDLVSGQRTPAVTIRPHDAAGLRLSFFGISRDGKYYFHNYARLMSDLFVVEGLK